MRSRKGGALDTYKALLASLNRATHRRRPVGAWPQALRAKLRSTNEPHQGEREKARRCRQMESGQMRNENRGSAG
jgi:hypothetical protein